MQGEEGYIYPKENRPTHAVEGTCNWRRYRGKTGRVFTKWARRIPNVSFTVVTVPASWTWWPEKEEHHEYSYEGSDELASEQLQKQREELHEVFSQGISDELHDTVFERTWKFVQEQIGNGSVLQYLKNRVWSRDTHTHTHTHTLYGT